MPVLTYRGSIPEIQGQKFDVPASVPQTSRAKWIESTWREEQARATATAEREAGSSSCSKSGSPSNGMRQRSKPN